MHNCPSYRTVLFSVVYGRWLVGRYDRSASFRYTHVLSQLSRGKFGSVFGLVGAKPVMAFSDLAKGGVHGKREARAFNAGLESLGDSLCPTSPEDVSF